jgi:hypothetical protein
LISSETEIKNRHRGDLLRGRVINMKQRESTAKVCLPVWSVGRLKKLHWRVQDLQILLGSVAVGVVSPGKLGTETGLCI